MIVITSDRIRSIVADCRTEADLVSALRSHKVKYTFSTDIGFTNIKIPCKAGTIRIYRTCSRSAPFRIVQDKISVYPFPVPLYSWND